MTDMLLKMASLPLLEMMDASGKLLMEGAMGVPRGLTRSMCREKEGVG